MKTKTLLSVMAFGLFVSAFSQNSTMELTFTAQNNGQYVPLDSILIENLLQGGDTTLYAPDTVLVLDYVTSIGNNETIEGNSFFVSQNYPNPFKGKTKVNLYLPEGENIKISVRDIVGRELTHYQKTLNRGNHTFSFYSGKGTYYFLTVTGKQTSKTIKMLNADSKTIYGGKCKIVYNGSENNENSFKSNKNIDSFGFNLGDELKYTVYSDIGVRARIDSPTGNQTYTFQFGIVSPCPDTPSVTDIDGNTYNTVQIGDQCWMKENLKTTTDRNGTSIPNVINDDNWSNLTTGAYVWYDNDISYKDSYGAMYNWYTTADANGLCPTGWHVPTVDEWTDLTDYIGGKDSPHGNELKSCRQVDSPLGGECNTIEHPRWSEDNNNWGTDDYGFSGLPGGYRHGNGTFYIIGEFGFWWSFTDSSSEYAWSRRLDYSEGNVTPATYTKDKGNSVRCIKDGD